MQFLLPRSLQILALGKYAKCLAVGLNYNFDKRNLIICSLKKKELPFQPCHSPVFMPLRSRFLSFSSIGDTDFSEVCQETLESISEYFEELVDLTPEFRNGDVTYSDGVLTAALGNNFGTYVINRQIPNKQIWLSSPISGPKRYDFIDGVWIYKHDNTTLHSLLDKEIQLITKAPIEFSIRCLFGRK